MTEALCPHLKPLSVKCGICKWFPAAAAQMKPKVSQEMKCRHLGEWQGERIANPAKAGERLNVFPCAVHGQCVQKGGPALKEAGVQMACCGCGCKERDLVPVGPKETILPNAALAACPDGHRFNASVIRHQGKLLMAYRAGRKGGQIYICELGADLMPGKSVRLDLQHHAATHGREDPRLFVHQGRLYVAFVGVVGGHGPTNCLYSLLTDSLKVEQIWYPHYAGRQQWEKNHTYISWGGELFAVYSISPHKILHVVHDTAREFQSVEWTPKWSGGKMRGGASPVLVEDEWWSFFHGVVEKGGALPGGRRAARRTYSIGAYTFENRPPFKPLRYTPEPLLWPNAATRPADFWADVVFVAGSVLSGDRWLVSAGLMDHQVGVYEWAKADVEGKLVAV